MEYHYPTTTTATTTTLFSPGLTVKAHDITYQRTTPSSASYPSSHNGILHCLYLERRVHTRALLFGAQIGVNPRDIAQIFYAMLIDYRSRSNLQGHSGRSSISAPIAGHASAPPAEVWKFGQGCQRAW